MTSRQLSSGRLLDMDVIKSLGISSWHKVEDEDFRRFVAPLISFDSILVKKQIVKNARPQNNNLQI